MKPGWLFGDQPGRVTSLVECRTINEGGSVGVKGRCRAGLMPSCQSILTAVTFSGQVKVAALSPVCGNVDPGDLEVELSGASHWNSVASCGKVQQLLLQLQGEGQHHVPEAPGGGEGGTGQSLRPLLA